MKDLLPGRRAVGEEEVDALAAKDRVAKSGGGALSRAKKVRAVLRVKVSEVGRVCSWDNQHVARHDRLNIHKDGRPLVGINKRDLSLFGGQLADQAIARRTTIYNRKLL